MSLIPRETSNPPIPFTPFSQDFWDHFSPNRFLQPFRNLPFPFLFPFPFPSPAFPFSGRTVPYSELSIESSGDVTARLECKEIPEAHIIVAELPGIHKDDVHVSSEDGGFVNIRGGDGRFSWRFRLPEDAKVGFMSFSMENGVLTVVVPKLSPDLEWDWNRASGRNGNEGRNVRVIEITGDDD